MDRDLTQTAFFNTEIPIVVYNITGHGNTFATLKSFYTISLFPWELSNPASMISR